MGVCGGAAALRRLLYVPERVVGPRPAPVLLATFFSCRTFLVGHPLGQPYMRVGRSHSQLVVGPLVGCSTGRTVGGVAMRPGSLGLLFSDSACCFLLVIFQPCHHVRLRFPP